MRLIITFTSFIQHSFGALSHSNQRRKRNERNPGWKRRNKTVTDRIPNVENSKDPTRKHQSSSMNLAKLQDIKLIQRNLYTRLTQRHLYTSTFLYTNNKRSERETKETISFTIRSKWIK